MCKETQLIVSYLIMITIVLPAIQGNHGLVVAQQLGGNDLANTSESFNDTMSQIQTEYLSNENQTQSFFNSDNRSVVLPEQIRDNIDQYVAESTGLSGPHEPADNNYETLKENMYVNNGVQQSISEEESFVTTFAACNNNDIPLSGGYSIVGAEEEDNSGEINEIESIPNIANSSWTINVEGEDVQITPYVYV